MYTFWGCKDLLWLLLTCTLFSPGYGKRLRLGYSSMVEHLPRVHSPGFSSASDVTVAAE